MQNRNRLEIFKLSFGKYVRYRTKLRSRKIKIEVLTTGMTEECTDRDLKELDLCIAKLTNSTVKLYKITERAPAEKTKYCELAKQERKCVDRLPACLSKYIDENPMIPIFYNHIGYLCINEGPWNYTCNEKGLNRCFANLRNFMIENFKESKPVDKSTYCESIVKEGNCISEASTDCKKKYPEMSAMISVFVKFLYQICSEVGQEVLLPCFENRTSEFEKCMPKGKTNPDDPVKDVCNSVSELQCVATQSKNLCKHIEVFGKELEYDISYLQEHRKLCISSLDSGIMSSMASGIMIGYFRFSCWILALMTVLLFSSKNNF